MSRTNFRIVALSALFLLAAMIAPAARAHPSYFDSRCASCHDDDTPTCNGCHHHRGTLVATADAAQYSPGAPVTVTLHGGLQTGWVRGLLYNESNVQIALLSGPTNTGDDGLGNPIMFPLQFHVTAPAAAGDYTWQAAWFGNLNDGGSAHGENRTPVVIHVVGTSSVPAENPGYLERTWGKIKNSFRR